MTRLMLTMALAAALLAGCARREPPPPEPGPVRQAPLPPSGGATSAADYVAAAGSIDLLTIKASEMAMARATSNRVKQLASSLLADHKGTSGQLSLAGRRLNLLPDATLQPLHRRMLDELTLSVAFDRLFVQHMTSVHRDSVALHSAFARDGDSPTLRPVARYAEKVERDHLAHLGDYR